MADIDPSIIFPPSNKIKRVSSLKGKFKKNWVEDTIHTDNLVNKEEFIQRGTSHIGSSFSVRKSFFFLFFVFLGIGIIFSRLIYLQIISGAKYRTLAENNSERILPIPSERGLIYDRKGRLLTKNIPNFFVVLVPLDLPRAKVEKEAVLEELSAIVGMEKNKIDELIQEYNHYRNDSIIIKEDVDYETALKIQIASADLPGVHIQRGSKRLYLNSLGDLNLNQSDSYTNNNSSTLIMSLSHILGYVGKLNPVELEENYSLGYLPSDSIGKVGVENSYENILRGKYGRRRIEVNSAGKEQSVLAEYAPESGSHLELSIDVAMQNQLEQIMQNYFKKFNKSKGAGIVMDPRNGKILAMVSLPSFNNNDFSGGIDNETYSRYLENPDQPLFNRNISGTYPSGSTIKMVFASGALQEGIINAATSFLSNGGLRIGQWFFPDWQFGGHGQTNVRKSIAWSVNTFYYYIGGGYHDFVGLGLEKLVTYLKLFGFGSDLGIDIIGEQSGFIPSREWKKETKKESWYIGDTYNLSIGQGDLLVTPLQIASLTAVVANGGSLYRPKLVNAIIHPDTNAKEEVKPELVRSNFISPNNMATVRLGMKDCVEYGSCRQLSSLPFPAAGKTGTAEWGNNKPNHAWFTSFAPFDNPRIVVTVLVEEGEEGSRISAPIAYDFYKWWWNYAKY